MSELNASDLERGMSVVMKIGSENNFTEVLLANENSAILAEEYGMGQYYIRENNRCFDVFKEGRNKTKFLGKAIVKD